MDLHILAFFNNRRCLITILHRLCSKQCMEKILTLLSHTRLTYITPVIQLMTDKKRQRRAATFLHHAFYDMLF